MSLLESKTLTNINRVTEGRRVGVKEKEKKREYIKHIQWFYLYPKLPHICHFAKFVIHVLQQC